MSNTPRKICVVLVDRANYGRLQPVMAEIAAHDGLELQIIAAGALVLDRFDSPVKVVEQDGFTITAEVFVELEGSRPATMAKSVGLAVVEFATQYQHLRPDLVLIIGDRYEALGAVIAAAYMNLCIAHIQGGEVSGSIDESARHAISKFSHYHFPATVRAAEYLERMGERPDTILTIGCPSSDIARTLDRPIDAALVNGIGSGATIDVSQPFGLAIFHPTTTQYGNEAEQMQEFLAALDEVALPTLMLWPNIDAGSDRLSKAVRVFREQRQPTWLRLITNLPPNDYLRVLGAAACAVGNSSSFVRDAGFFGTPVVLAGNRQDGRESDEHAIRVPAVRKAIADAVRSQLAHGRYPASSLYGDGHVARRIADALAELKPYVQKRLHFVSEQQ